MEKPYCKMDFPEFAKRKGYSKGDYKQRNDVCKKQVFIPECNRMVCKQAHKREQGPGYADS